MENVAWKQNKTKKSVNYNRTQQNNRYEPKSREYDKSIGSSFKYTESEYYRNM